MLVLGLDVATITGYAYSSGRDASGIVSGSFTYKAKDSFQVEAGLRNKMHAIIKSNPKPDLCVVEKPVLMPRNARTSATLRGFCSALCAVVSGYGVPIILVDIPTWRGKMYGSSSKKALGIDDWKKHARFHCEKVLKVDVKNNDEAEAVLISQYGFYTQTYKQMILKGETRQNA